MTAQDARPRTAGAHDEIRPAPLLRAALLADAAVSGGSGLLLAALAPSLRDLLGLPQGLLHATGPALIPWAAFVLWVATRAPVPSGPARFIVAANAVWVAASLAAPAILSPTATGFAFVLVQALVVAGLAIVQAIALRREACARA